MSPTAKFDSRVERSDSFPTDQFQVEKDLLIVDKNVLAQWPKLRETWKFVYAVEAGEELKSLEKFPAHMAALLDTWGIHILRSSRIVACGGGSVGDFAGFVASVLKRGVQLSHVPSTWLAAIDSAHGGKTALNVHGAKNQIGTFYPAESVYLVREILLSQPEARAFEALGELFKIALIDKDRMFNALADVSKIEATELLWDYLQSAVDIKYEIVLRDPYELLGERKILNLGHTLGHVLESFYRRSHGECVMQGLWFALEWSAHRGLLAKETWENIKTVFERWGLFCWTARAGFTPLTEDIAADLLGKDKKMTGEEKLDFVFLEDIGIPRVESVSLGDILSESRRQGWTRG